MDKKELIRVLGDLDWTMARLASEMELDTSTISRWKEVPVPVDRYLRLLLRVRMLGEVLGDWL